MKTTTRTPAPIKAYTDDDGNPVCGDCDLKTLDYSGRCKYQGEDCPVWGEGSKEVVE